MKLHVIEPPTKADADKLAELIENGRKDYDILAARVIEACSSNDYITKALLQAPADTASSAAPKEAGTNAKSSDQVDEREVIVIESSDEEDASAIGTKRKRENVLDEAKSMLAERKKRKGSPTKQVFCLNCNEVFDLEDNEEGSCHYHPGESELGELEDNPCDDQIEDDIDSRKTWPNAFQWTCCGNDLEVNEPCEVSAHRAAGDRLDYAEWQEEQNWTWKKVRVE